MPALWSRIVRVGRILPSLQRQFLYILVAAFVLFLIYLLSDLAGPRGEHPQRPDAPLNDLRPDDLRPELLRPVGPPRRVKVEPRQLGGRTGGKLGGMEAVEQIGVRGQELQPTEFPRPQGDVADWTQRRLELSPPVVHVETENGGSDSADAVRLDKRGNQSEAVMPILLVQRSGERHDQKQEFNEEADQSEQTSDNNKQNQGAKKGDRWRGQFSEPPVSFKGPSNEKQREIVSAFLHGWNAYREHAWGHDELKPLSQSWQEWMGVGLTLVDSLDTMYIMGLESEFREARDWVANSLNYERDTEVQLFEITIRVMGGLLSAYYLSHDPVFLEKAVELGDKLEPCFGGVTPIPCNRINMKRRGPSFIEISVAEAGTIQLEFLALSRASNDSKYETLATSIAAHLHKLPKLDGLVSCALNPFSGVLHKTAPASVGAGCDSYYEYLLKQWIHTGKTRDWLKQDYLDAVEGVKKHLLRRSEPSKLAFLGSLSTFSADAFFRNDMEHFVCFLPGTLALGVLHGLDPSHLNLAADLTRTCVQLYQSQPTGLSPEIVTMNLDPKGRVDILVPLNERFNLQRPETVESLLYMYRATGDEKYRTWGWTIFKALERYTRVEGGGYASIDNVQDVQDPGYRDKMETFYLAETLKYLYMLFDDDNILPLDQYVINTEAHPLPIYAH